MLSFTKLAVVATLIAVAFAKPWPHRNISVSAYSDPLCGTWANNFTIEEGKCLPQQSGASGKLFCMKMHKGRCIKLDVWNTSATCSGAETLKSAIRCGACERSDNGKFIRIECGNPNATKWDAFYNCADNTCRPESCNKTTIEPSKCHGGLLHPNAGFIASASYDCPDVLAWVTFTDNNCTRADKNGAAVFPANACLAGYKYWCPQ